MREITDSTFYSEIIKSNWPLTIVDYWAPWCQPCLALGKILEQVEVERPSVQVFKLNIDENPICGEGILAVPTLKFFRLGGRLEESKTGALSKRQVLAEVDRLLILR